MKALALVLLFIALGWLVFGGMFAFLGRMSRQGLAPGCNPAAEAVALRHERWAGKAASLMYRRLWPVPVLALVGFVVIAATERI